MARPQPQAKKDTYHHGDLRSALVEVALERVRRGGIDQFSLREAAREVGVTSGAVYKHFADKDQLLAAVAGEALSLLAKRSFKATAGLEGAARLHAAARAYIDFASAEPLLFRLAFSRFGAIGGECAPQGDGGTIPSAFEQLRMAVAGVRADPRTQVDTDVLAFAWAIAHGAASLISDGMWKKNDPRAEAALRLSFTILSGKSKT
ncbi:MAG: TetR/AcrR family transcriptional regulator [Pseudomonadota bacterium]|jgi:AcrR family transcriptional regulator